MTLGAGSHQLVMQRCVKRDSKVKSGPDEKERRISDVCCVQRIGGGGKSLRNLPSLTA